MFCCTPSSLSDLEVFIKKASAGLAHTVEEGDYDSLVGVMMHLLAVKDRQAATDNMFEPLKQTIELLKSYDQELSDDVHQQLQELPEQWNAVKKQSMVVKQDVAPLQTTEANNIRRKANTFDVSAQLCRCSCTSFELSSSMTLRRILLPYMCVLRTEVNALYTVCDCSLIEMTCTCACAQGHECHCPCNAGEAT